MNINIELIINSNVLSQSKVCHNSIGNKYIITKYYLNNSDLDNYQSAETYPFEALYQDIKEHMEITREWLASCFLRGDIVEFYIDKNEERVSIKSI